MRPGQSTVLRAKTAVLVCIAAAALLPALFGSEGAVALSQWVHQQWQTDRGLPQNSVFCFAQDTNGFLWFGTENGLVRYDGVEHRVFNQQTPPKIRHSFVSSLLVGRDGSLWAGTKTGGLVRYRLDNLEEPYQVITEEPIYALAEGSDSTIWAGSNSGLVRARLADGVPSRLTVSRLGVKDGLPYKKVSALCAARDGALWIGCDNGELAVLREGAITQVSYPRSTHRSAILALAENHASGELWLAHDGDGLFRLRQNRFTRVVLSDRPIENLQGLCVDREGAVWIGTQRDGIIRYQDGQISTFNSRDGLSTDDVISLFEDQEGSIWAGTLFGGLQRFFRGAASTFGRPEGLDAESVTTVLEVAPGVLWIGTHTAGVLKFSGGKFEPLHIPALSRDIRAMLRTRNGDIWLGGKESGLIRLHGAEQSQITFREGLLANDVCALFEARSGEIWAGSERSGITVVDARGVKGTFTNEFFRGAHIRCFAEDQHGTIWIGTQNGLVRYKDGIFQPNYLAAFPDACIRSILCADKNTLWVGTRDDGLLRLTEGGLFQYDLKAGLVHTRIYQLLGNRDNLWIAGNRGIERVSFADLEAVADGRKPRFFSQVLTEQDGLRTVECGSDANPSAAVASNGVLWFGTRRGLAAIRPEDSFNPLPAPRVLVSKVRLDQSTVPAKSFTEVPAGTTRVQFSYTAAELLHGGDILYRYKLEGVDKNWMEAGKEREAVYSYLKPGRYTFSVCASNPQGVWGNGQTTLSFSVAPRFYQTAWFLLSAIVAGVGGVRGFYQWRVAGIQRRNETLQQLVRVRTAELEEEIGQRKRAEEQQLALNLDLENRVAVRTSELSGAYQDLQKELRERERIEAELAASEGRLRRVVDSGMVGISFWNKDGRIFDANDTFLRMIGYTREELEHGEIFWDKLTPPEHASLDQAGLLEIERTGVCTPFEKEYIRKDGSRFPILLGGASLGTKKDEGVCFVLDISERKASEQQVLQLAESLECRVQERTLELARINQQLATEVQERKRVAIALSAFSQLGQKLHSARTEREAANIIALTAKSLIPHDLCSIELYGPDNKLYPAIGPSSNPETLSSEPIRSSISVPIRNGSRVIGVIGLQSTTPDTLNIGDANTLQALGDYCGGALDRIHAEEARRETERRFSAFMANAPALAWMKDAKLRYVFTNPMFQEFLGLSAEQIEEKTDSELWPEPTAARIRSNDQRVLEAEQTLETQEALRRADEQTRTLLTLRFPFTTAGGERFVAGMAVDITEQKRAEEALHRLPQSILEAQEQERRRLARELHDSVNQAIASAKFRIQTAENQIIRGDSKWQESCGKSKEMLDLVLQQVRRLSHNLRPGELDDLGLLPAARTAFREFEARTGIVVHFVALGFDTRLEPTLESTFYRIIQEALTNIEKHSSATAVDIDLSESDGALSLEISDNGIGFDPAQNKHSRDGLGLLHMRERSSLIGGEFSIQTNPGEGVRLRVHVNRERISNA